MQQCFWRPKLKSCRQFLLSTYSKKSHWTILPKYFGLFIPTGNRSCPNFMGFISQHEQAEQLGKEFLVPGRNSWGCERGSWKKKPAKLCCGNLDYGILHCTVNMHFIFTGNTAGIKISLSQLTLSSLYKHRLSLSNLKNRRWTTLCIYSNVSCSKYCLKIWNCLKVVISTLNYVLFFFLSTSEK